MWKAFRAMTFNILGLRLFTSHRSSSQRNVQYSAVANGKNLEKPMDKRSFQKRNNQPTMVHSDLSNAHQQTIFRKDLERSILEMAFIDWYVFVTHRPRHGQGAPAVAPPTPKFRFPTLTGHNGGVFYTGWQNFGRNTITHTSPRGLRHNHHPCGFKILVSSRCIPTRPYAYPILIFITVDRLKFHNKAK